MKTGAMRIFRFAKRLLFRNFGIKILSLFLACHVYFSIRPAPDADPNAQKQKTTAPQLLPIVAPEPAERTVIYVTNTVVVVSNMAAAAEAPRPDGAPAQAAEKAGAEGR